MSAGSTPPTTHSHPCATWRWPLPRLLSQPPFPQPRGCSSVFRAQGGCQPAVRRRKVLAEPPTPHRAGAGCLRFHRWPRIPSVRPRHPVHNVEVQMHLGAVTRGDPASEEEGGSRTFLGGAMGTGCRQGQGGWKRGYGPVGLRANVDSGTWGRCKACLAAWATPAHKAGVRGSPLEPGHHRPLAFS